MARAEGTIWCDGCGVEITWGPVIDKRGEFCCQDCLHGFVCKCGDRWEEEDRRVSGEIVNIM